MSLFKSIDKLKDNDDLKVISSGFKISTVEYTYTTFLKRLKEGSFTDNQIQQNILMHFNNYCNYDNFQNPELRSIFQEIWSNEKFVEIFSYCAPTIKKDLRIYYNKSICKIAYDYYSEKDDNDIVTGYLFQIVKIINLDIVLPLTQYMQDNHAIFLVMCNFSSFDKKECIDRINKFIVYGGYDFSVRDIIDIYLRLSRGDHFTSYFKYTMTQIIENLDTMQSTLYHRSTYAMLIIINSMPMNELIKLLSGYKSFLEYSKLPTRININELQPNEYDRIVTALNNII